MFYGLQVEPFVAHKQSYAFFGVSEVFFSLILAHLSSVATRGRSSPCV